MTTDQTEATITCACCGRAVTGSLCCPKLLGSAWGAKCPEHAPDHRAEAERMSAARPAVAEVHALLSIDARLARLDDTLRSILCWEEPPEEVLARVKAETMEEAAQDGEDAPLASAGHDQAPSDPRPAADAPEAAQTLADLTPRLGDRVRARSICFPERVYRFRFGWFQSTKTSGFFAWCNEAEHTYLSPDSNWTVLEHLDPVTPEEPPVGAGMLVDQLGYLFYRRDDGKWLVRHPKDTCWQAPSWEWAELTDLSLSRFRPATPADLAEHGVDEQGEPVGKGEADTLAVTLERREDDMTAAEARKAARIARGITSDSTATRLLDAYADALDGAR